MSHRRIVATLALVVFCLVSFAGVALAIESPSSDSPPSPAQSPYLIVEFDAPPLAAVYKTQLQAASANGKLDVNSVSAQAYVAELQAQQAAFVSQMQTVLPNATVAQFYADEALQVKEALTYQVVFNGMAVNPGTSDLEAANRLLATLPGVRAVYPDRPNFTDLYTSTQLINAPAVWNVLGGRENAGAGVKFASVDGGIHHLAPMFSGEGYDYPAGFGPQGKGLINNNNGKIITSRAYFREWDPPQVEDLGLPQTQCGDACAWPGPRGTSHGVHTSSIAAGNVVTDAEYSGFPVGTISGVAPRAYVMSYKVFYGSVDNDGSFYDAEGIAALEDVAIDGADVVNNSWGGGPTSIGGPGDPLDTALRNLAASGVFVSMSAGNAGPSLATTDHPSDDYIIAAATTTSGTIASGRLRVPGDEDLQNIPFTEASFGAELPPVGTVITYSVLPAASVDPANVEGCSAWPAGTFDGRAALIRRGTCEFGVKVLNAEQAGAEFAIVYNNPAGGDELISMGPGAVGDQVTIGAVFIGNTAGQAIVDAFASDPATQVVLDMQLFQAGNTADVVANFSSRGAGIGSVLKPDIAAPGVNILAQGYDPDADGEAAHLGYGQVSGTSMASPHVAGAAVLVRQAYPSWPNAAIKSALMSTAKYTDVYNANGSPAQPLDIGAGRLDLTHVLDPGVILDPPSLSFGLVQSGTVDSIVVTVTSVATQTETYEISTLYTGNGFTATTALDGFSVSPASITLEAGQSTQFTVTVDSTATPGVGDSQGYVILDGPVHDAHMPAWARITPAAQLADVLIIDNDASDLEPTFGDYLSFYTSTVEALGRSYAVVNTADSFGQSTTIPGPAELVGYGAVLWFTGDNYVTIAGLTDQDQSTLLEYLNNGGKVIAMGQDLASTIDAVTAGVTPPVLYSFGLGAEWLQDSISDGEVPGGYATSAPNAPEIFRDLVVRPTQVWVDEVEPAADPPEADSYGRDAQRVLNYGGPFNIDEGTVALIHRDQPSLELPDIPYLGKAFYATFGLEGMDVLTVTEGFTTTSPVEFLDTVFEWTDSEAGSATISNTTPISATGITLFMANYTSPEGYEATDWRWDFGDGSPFVISESEAAGHTYACSDDNTVTVRVEVTDEAGNRAIGSLEVDVSDTCFEETRGFFLPFIPRDSVVTP
jgi:subtilisin family serine protease